MIMMMIAITITTKTLIVVITEAAGIKEAEEVKSLELGRGEGDMVELHPSTTNKGKQPKIKQNYKKHSKNIPPLKDGEGKDWTGEEEKCPSYL